MLLAGPGSPAAPSAAALHLSAAVMAVRGGPRSDAVGGDLRVTRKHLVDALIGASEQPDERGPDLDHALREIFGGVQGDELVAVALHVDAASLPAHRFRVHVEH